MPLLIPHMLSKHLSLYVMFLFMTPALYIQERFVEFMDCNRKTRAEIAQLIQDFLCKHGLPINNCRGQGYDNGSNMAGKYNGAQANILALNPLALFSPCACHSLNLCGLHAAECCPEVQKFFGVVQKLYNLFSSSPAQWELLTGCSLFHTRWSDRVESVKPFAANIPSILASLDAVLQFNLSSEAKNDVHALKKYVNSFTCVLLAAIWFKVLSAIDIRNKVLQAHN